MLNVWRDPLFLSTTTLGSNNGLRFTRTAVIGSCEQSAIFASPPAQPWACLPRSKEGSISGLQYPQAAAVTAPESVAGLWVILSLNREDIWIANVPFSAI